MKIVVMILVVLSLSLSLCWAQKPPMEKAYSYYFQGKMEEAISIMKEEESSRMRSGAIQAWDGSMAYPGLIKRNISNHS